MVEQFARHLRIGFDAAAPVFRAGVDRRVKGVAEILGESGELAGADVQRDGFDAGLDEFFPRRRIFQARGAPHLVSRCRQGARDGKRDLARRPGDQDLLRFEQPGPPMLST